MELVETPYTAIIESDVIITSFNWNNLEEEYDLKVVSRGKVNLWHLCFTVFKTHLFKDMDFCPTENRDAGSKRFEIVEKGNYKAKVIDMQPCYTGDIRYFKNIINKKSFEIVEDNETIAAHFGRGSDLARVNDFEKALKRWTRICSSIVPLKGR